MLKKLLIKNIILIDSAEIDFAEGFNVLSGETGSGKSAIMNAIHLISGNRADTGVVRKGEEKATVEAIFDIQRMPGIETLLDQAGIEMDEGSELYLKREITAAGKSRAFINNQLAQLSLLKAVTLPLFNIVGQHATQDLFSLDCHRGILDLFGDLQEDVLAFSHSWAEEGRLEAELTTLIDSEASRLREIEVCQMELDELSEANIKEGEDDELFQEYALLAHSHEIASKVDEITQTLNGERLSLLSQLHRQKNVFDDVANIDKSLLDLSTSYKNAVLELQEVVHSLDLYRSRLDQDPIRLEEVNERLALITRLKKKYGSTLQEIQTFATDRKTQLSLLENADNRIEELKEELAKIKEKNHELAKKLTEIRMHIAQKLALALKTELKTLNIPQVDFQIDVQPQKRSRYGDDRVEFFLSPNVGEHRIPIRECASGGELSRVMLSLQTVLSGKQNIFTLIFDEIDGNIGGETAAIVGEKLKVIGKKQQILCVTHFPQVAKYADHHLQISKQTVGERTFTFVNPLNESARERELTRMMGNEVNT